VRRLFLFLEQTIHAGLSWVSFEPNGEPLWAEIRQDLSQLLARLWREGAFPGDRPSEAFFVRCDETTMTQDDLATGRVVCLVGIAPIAPSEFVTFTVSRATAAPDGTVRTPST
jgi:phage tail sheath protein FI